MKTVFITGANRGLGKGFVEFFLANDFFVFAGVRNPEVFNSELRTYPNLKIVQIDIADDQSIQKAFEVIRKQITSLDYLVNNAGLNKDSATDNHKELVCNLTQLNRQALLRMFDVNAVSAMIVLKTFIPLLNGDPSFVINVSSARGSYQDENENSTGNYGYRASKAALNMLTFCVLTDLPQNVKIYAVHPGNVHTDMNPSGTDLPIIQAEKIYRISDNWKEEFNGNFLRYDGSIYPK